MFVSMIDYVKLVGYVPAVVIYQHSNIHHSDTSHANTLTKGQYDVNAIF